MGLVVRQGGDRQAEVANLDRPVEPDEAVRRLDVPVQHVDPGRGVEPGDQLERRIDRVGRLERAAGTHLVLERPVRRQLHGDGRHTLDLLGAVDVDRVRMAHGGRQAALA